MRCNLSKTIAVRMLCSLVLTSGATVAQSGYWHTSGNQILDSNNNPVRMAGVNWYGFETTWFVAGGLQFQDYHTILSAIKNNGYNVIRMGFSNQMIESPIVPTRIVTTSINTDLQGLNSLQILDKIITAAGSLGLRIILDNHRSEAGSSAEANGLWYTSTYPESAWINDWVTLAGRYMNNPTVVGMDLRNEPHNANSGGSCWGCGTMTNDWRLAAERAGNAILAVNPNLLIFVEGIDYYNGDYSWWGGNLEGAQTFPVVLNVSNRLVYSAHDYGPNNYLQGWFNSSTTYSSLVALWTKWWGYLSLNHIAPVWVGEFGTTNNNSDIVGTTAGSQGQWFESLVTFLLNNPAISWSYWTLDGEDSYALLDSSYDSTPVNPMKQAMLASIQTLKAPEASFRDPAGGIHLSSYAISALANGGGVFSSDPTSAEDPWGKTVVTARDGFNSIWANVYNPASATWNGWVFGGGIIQGVPSIAVDTSGTGWIASRDNYNSYWLVMYTPTGGFGSWVPLLGIFASDPVVSACGDGSIYLIGKDNFNSLWSGHYIPGTGFQGWHFGGGIITGKPAATCGGDNAVYVAAEDNYNSNWIARVAGNTWTGWFFGGAITSVTPRIAALGNGSEAVVILDATGVVWRTTFTEGAGNGWQPWVQVGGILQDVAPAGLSGELYLAGKAPNGDLWWWQQTSNQWTRIGNNGAAAGALSGTPH